MPKEETKARSRRPSILKLIAKPFADQEELREMYNTVYSHSWPIDAAAWKQIVEDLVRGDADARERAKKRLASKRMMHNDRCRDYFNTVIKKRPPPYTRV